MLNIAIAWFQSGPPSDDSILDRTEWIIEPGLRNWSIMRWQGSGCTMLVAQANAIQDSIYAQSYMDARIPGWSRLHQLPACEPGQWLMMHDIAFGWPFRSLYLHQSIEMDQTTATTKSRKLYGAVPELILPYYVIPLGFIANTLIYGGIMWVWIFMWRVAKKIHATPKRALHEMRLQPSRH
ncbi:MAG: hypothetical protein O7G85_15800 [Planctomycetota bacterium]|nr:hypothetical protein [Planctomycetota bacterium]